MKTELKPHQIEKEIEDRLSADALACWNGMTRESKDEAVVIAQRQGIDAAVAEVESLVEDPPTTRYTIRRYNDGQAIGEANLTPEQFDRYVAASQQPEGIIRLGDMPHDCDLDGDADADTLVYLE